MNKETNGFTEEEKAAMKAHVKELKRSKKRNVEEDKQALLDAIAAMPPDGRAMAEKLHEIITANGSDLSPKTWYGMPAYANADGKVVVFFRGAEKFKERYLTLGFNQEASLDEGSMWPIAYALTALTPADEKRIADLIKRARGNE